MCPIIVVVAAYDVASPATASVVVDVVHDDIFTASEVSPLLQMLLAFS